MQDYMDRKFDELDDKLKNIEDLLEKNEDEFDEFHKKLDRLEDLLRDIKEKVS